MEICGEFVTSQRTDVGIGPYKEPFAPEAPAPVVNTIYFYIVYLQVVIMDMSLLKFH